MWIMIHVDCDPDSNPDSGPGARVNAANVYLRVMGLEPMTQRIKTLRGCGSKEGGDQKRVGSCVVSTDSFVRYH